MCLVQIDYVEGDVGSLEKSAQKSNKQKKVSNNPKDINLKEGLHLLMYILECIEWTLGGSCFLMSHTS